MIVDELIKIQKQSGLKNKEFAKTLGIHIVSWYRIKNKGVIGAETLLRAFEVYPEVRKKFLESFTDLPQKLSGQRETPLKRLLAVFHYWLNKGVKRLCSLVRTTK